ncbi:MAG: response regulator [Candidatus Latescibacteria bacterium]|jgi:PAS domain S-box-containing protein|nr:response regulator [Candidatus Latescibacterota bacterium]
MDNNEIEILIVEDSLTQSVSLQSFLEKHGYRVSTSSNGKEAFDFLEGHLPTLVISDIMMPEMDGWELTRLIKADDNLKDIPVILLTSLSSPVDLIKALECGADNFVTKPYNEQLILSRIQNIVEEKILKKSEESEEDIRISFAGEDHLITADRKQIIDFLLSAYENVIVKNRDFEEANEKLREANNEIQKLASIVENSTDLVAAVATTEGKMLYINHAGKKILGLPSNKASDVAIFDFCVDDDCDSLKEHAIFETRDKGSWQGELRFRQQLTGEEIPVLVSLFNIKDPQTNQLLGIGLIAHDMTERKKMENELLIEKERAEAASRAKSDFLSSMSHELRTPLNAIIGFSELLHDKYVGGLSETQSQYVKDIWESGKHLLSLINDVLDLSKIEAGKMELYLSNVKIKKLLEKSLVMIRERCIQHHISIDLSVSQDVEYLEITADTRKLKQIMFNLLSNAAKFTPDEGTITVEAGMNGKEILISVTDTGIGIAPEHQEKIFEEFYQVQGGTTDKTPGTGLGLSLVRRIIEMHGGKIWIESEGSEKGSRFAFTLPLQLEVLK